MDNSTRTSPYRRKSIFDLGTFRVTAGRQFGDDEARQAVGNDGTSRRKSLRGLLHATVRGVRNMLPLSFADPPSTQAPVVPATRKPRDRSKSVGYMGHTGQLQNASRHNETANKSQNAAQLQCLAAEACTTLSGV